MKNPLTLEAFADWVEKQPADEAYDYTNTCGCAFWMYAKFLGFEDPNVGGTGWYPSQGEWRVFPAGLEDALKYRPWTFGALATRLRSHSENPL